MFGRLRSIFRQADHDQEWRPVDLNALVEQAAALTRPRWHGQALGQGITIALRTALASGLPMLLADAAELREMLTNLIFNAVDALPQRRGDHVLRTRVQGGEVALEVGDTGTGMDEETRRRCLEPFFTTKGPEGHGPGAGDGLRHDAAPRRAHRPAKRPGPGHHIHFPAAAPARRRRRRRRFRPT